MDDQGIYVMDKDLNIIHDLKQKPYLFNTTVGSFNNRFVLRYGDKTLAVDKNNANNDDKKSLTFKTATFL